MKRSLPLLFGTLFSMAVFAQAPVANFDADTNIVCVGGSIGFFDQSTNTPTAWNWSFPGGTPNSSTLQNPSILYNTPGVYSVTLTASNGSGNNTFTRTNYINVNAPPSISNAGPDQTICISTSSVTLAANSPTVGIGQWTVSFGTGTFANSFSPTTTVTGMSVGVNTYQWTIANDPCPTSFDQVNINVDDVPTVANAGPDQNLCSTGTATLAGNTPTVGTGVWTLISGSGTVTNPNQPNSGITGLGNGPNVFQWTISNGVCTSSSDQVTITINAAPTVVCTPNIGSICIGQNIPLIASGANTYAWSPSSTLSSSTGSNVTATPTVTTTYFIVGTDANGCVGNTSVTIFVNAYPTVTVTPTSANVCSNQPIPVTASGAPLFTWAPSSTLSSNSGATVNALPTAVTTYTVTGNNNGCLATTTFTLTPIPAPTATVTPNSTLICAGNPLNLTATGGGTYSWTPSTSLNSSTGANVIATPTTSTAYSVIVTAGNGCSDTAVALIAVNQPANTVVFPPNPSICFGDTVMMTAGGAQTYSWAPATGLDVTTGSLVHANPTVTTTYTITGTVPGCGVSILLQTVTVNPVPSVTVTPSTVAICQGSFVNLVANGAASYSWTPATGLSSTTGAVVTANPTTATTYFVTGTNSFGCSTTVIANVNVNPSYSLNTLTTPVVCGNGNNGTASVTPNGGTPPYTYVWSDPFNQTTATAFGLTAGNYSVVVTDANGCSQTANVTVSSVNPMSMNLVYTDAICYGSTNGTATVTASGGTSPYTYLWSDPLSQTTATADSLAAGTYTVTVQDSNGCAQLVSVTVSQPQPISDSATVLDGQCHGQNGSVALMVSGGSSPYSFAWSNGTSGQTLAGVGQGTYYVTVTDNHGCTFRDTVAVGNIETPACLFIPNAFSPNGDGEHDYWMIGDITQFSNVKVSIFNRWGNKVYENAEYKNTWDGLTTDGNKLPGGVYYYVIEFDNGASPTMEGSVTLMR